MEFEKRFIEGLEIRSTGPKRGIEGYAALYDTPALIGGTFVEVIKRGAFDHLLDGDIIATFNHDPKELLGRTPLTLRLRSDDKGLWYEIPKMPKARADVLESIERGEVRGSSMVFGIKRDSDGESWSYRDGEPPLRTITRADALQEVGPVLYPAYAETSVSARCLAKCLDFGQESVILNNNNQLERALARLKLAEVEN